MVGFSSGSGGTQAIPAAANQPTPTRMLSLMYWKYGLSSFLPTFFWRPLPANHWSTMEA